ncbi:unnamed protein product [Staurois parvus]|uniref:Uncharacterized protein n=1 Tax=Staurois parvus TaxID=386267 RepID=A0ABN9FWH9_9NEOB|nr:unnamed protein product [Staurois parvus]
MGGGGGSCCFRYPWSFILRDNYRNSGFETTPIKLKKIKKGQRGEYDKTGGNVMEILYCCRTLIVS